MNNMNRLVVKIGTSVIADSVNFNYELLEKIFKNIVELTNMGKEVIVVTSGAVGLGALSMDIHEKPQQTHMKQALSTIGQTKLMLYYEKMASKYNKKIAQFLITKDIISEKNSILRLKKAFDYLLEKGVIPIVNENDATVFGDMQIGDNDTVSAIIGHITKCDAVVLISDVDGIYTKNPKEYDNATRIPIITDIDDEIINCASCKTSNFTSGGMATKINAAKIAQQNKFNMFIVNGNVPESLLQLINGEDVGTGFIFRS